MFTAEAISLLACPACGASPLGHQVFEGDGGGRIKEAVVSCQKCRAWFPLDGGVLDLLLGDLSYPNDRKRFAARHAAELRAANLDEHLGHGAATDAALQSKQQEHFDWYAKNETQSYLEYEQMPFWDAVDAITFERWRPRLPAGGWLLDVGCGNGRSTFKIAERPIKVLAFDVSKGAIRQAEERALSQPHAAELCFFTADATRFPVRSAVLDNVLIYGVLHHVPDPRVACREVARVLKPGGVYFGSENNETIFRKAFDLLQKLRPIWYEEAGPEALISDTTLRAAFSDTGVSLKTESTVFVPPHLINLLPRAWGQPLLRASDALGHALPVVSRNGGLILIEGVKA